MRKGLDKEYKRLRIEYLQSHPLCKARLKGCQLRSSQIHHKKGRVGSDYLNCDDWMALCANCHEIIENNPIIAIELGFSKSRLNK